MSNYTVIVNRQDGTEVFRCEGGAITHSVPGPLSSCTLYASEPTRVDPVDILRKQLDFLLSMQTRCCEVHEASKLTEAILLTLEALNDYTDDE